LVPIEQYAAGYTFEEIVAEELLILKECIARPGSKNWAEFLKCHSEEATKSTYPGRDFVHAKCQRAGTHPA
jgi:hypothetical protein